MNPVNYSQVSNETESKQQLIIRGKDAEKSASHSNWIIGECASKFVASGFGTVESFADSIEIDRRRAGECKRVYEERKKYFGDQALQWSHLVASLPWEDWEDMLDWSLENQSSVREMVAFRNISNGVSVESEADKRMDFLLPETVQPVREPPSRKENKKSSSHQPQPARPQVEREELLWNVAPANSLTVVSSTDDILNDIRKKIQRIIKQEELVRLAHSLQEIVNSILGTVSPVLPEPVPYEANVTSVNMVAEYWNLLGLPFKKVATLSPTRISKVKTRLSNKFFFDHWQEALIKLSEDASLDWMRGNNNRGWIADFDFFIKPDTVLKIIEETYGNANQNEAAFREVFGD